MAIDLASSYFPSWEESPSVWDECWLGGSLLPGVTMISSIDCGPRIDKQTRRKREGQKFADDGMKPAKFTITQTIPPQLWGAWVDVLPKIYTTKPKGPREPLPIVHPLPNHMGIDTVYVTSVKPGDPGDSGFFKVSIEVEQWFAELKEPNTKNKVDPKLSLAALSNLGKAALDSGLVTALPPVGPLLSRAIYGKPPPAKETPQKKQTTRGDSNVKPPTTFLGIGIPTGGR